MIAIMVVGEVSSQRWATLMPTETVNMRRPEHALFLALLLASPAWTTPTSAATAHEHHGTASGEGHAVESGGPRADTALALDAIAVPTLGGQYAFATIAEIVILLERDPATDWTRVDLERLRQHLVDMHRVTLGAEVEAVEVQGGARFSITSSEAAIEDSIRRMTRAHASAVTPSIEGGGDEGTVWRYALDTLPDGVTFTVTGEDEKSADRIRAYGFIGVMVAGTHHPRHHLALARGEDPHAHRDAARDTRKTRR